MVLRSISVPSRRARTMLMTAPVDWLHELAKGSIKTQWGEMMKAEDPAEEASEKVGKRLNMMYSNRIVLAFMIVAPLVAERLAIAECKLKNPQIEAVAPEILSYQEALEIAMKEVWHLTTEEKQKILTLLKKDPSMQPLKK
jgi:hypothetical protein